MAVESRLGLSIYVVYIGLVPGRALIIATAEHLVQEATEHANTNETT